MANKAELADHLLSIPRTIEPHPLAAMVGQKHGSDYLAMYGADGRLAFIFDSRTEVDIQVPDGDEPITAGVLARANMVSFDDCDLDGLTYFIGGDVGAIKIGRSVNPEKRLKEFQAGSPIVLRILATRQGAQREPMYHRHFKAHRLHGEWFDRHPDILAEIDRLNNVGPKRGRNLIPALTYDEVTSHG